MEKLVWSWVRALKFVPKNGSYNDQNCPHIFWIESQARRVFQSIDLFSIFSFLLPFCHIFRIWTASKFVSKSPCEMTTTAPATSFKNDSERPLQSFCYSSFFLSFFLSRVKAFFFLSQRRFQCPNDWLQHLVKRCRQARQSVPIIGSFVVFNAVSIIFFSSFFFF